MPLFGRAGLEGLPVPGLALVGEGLEPGHEDLLLRGRVAVAQGQVDEDLDAGLSGARRVGGGQIVSTSASSIAARGRRIHRGVQASPVASRPAATPAAPARTEGKSVCAVTAESALSESRRFTADLR